LRPNGKVLVAGGVRTPFIGSAALASAELYDPATGIWTNTGSMTTNRAHHTATLLFDGTVLVAGGNPSGGFNPVSLASAEIYDPVTGVWKGTSSMNIARASHTATPLPDGRVVVACGYDNGYLRTSEYYDPSTRIWTVTDGQTDAATTSHTTTLLANGRLLIVGGWNGDSSTNRAELFDVGLDILPGQEPHIVTASSPLTLGSSLVITGDQFRGQSQASGGNAGQDSPTDFPVVQLRRLDNEQILYVVSTNWSTNVFMSAPLVGFPFGHAIVTVFVSALPSISRVVNIIPPPPFQLTGMTIAGGAFQFGFTNTPNVPFTVLGSFDVSLPPGNWTVLGSATETSPGQFQFSDLQVTNRAQRFYRVRSP
jgi:hypothetical protein